MTNQFTVCVANIQTVTDFGRTRIRTLINSPYTLAYKKLPAAAQGGNRTRLYRLDQILVRLRNHKNVTEEMINTLITVNATFRNKETT